jgi:hypothetical protein
MAQTTNQDDDLLILSDDTDSSSNVALEVNEGDNAKAEDIIISS